MLSISSDGYFNTIKPQPLNCFHKKVALRSFPCTCQVICLSNVLLEAFDWRRKYSDLPKCAGTSSEDGERLQKSWLRSSVKQFGDSVDSEPG